MMDKDDSQPKPVSTQVSLLIRRDFRILFGQRESQRCGHFVDSTMSQICYRYSLWVEYPSQNRTMTMHTDEVTACVVHSEGRYLYTASMDHSIIEWDLSSTHVDSTTARKWRAHEGWIRALALNGELLASGCDDRSIAIWHCFSHDRLRTLTGHTSNIMALEFDRKGKVLLSASSDTTMRMWSVDNGRCLKQFAGHKRHITSAVWIYDDSVILSSSMMILSGSYDGSLKIWDSELDRMSESDEESCVRTVSDEIDGTLDGVRDLSVNGDCSLIACANQSSLVVYRWPSLEIYDTVMKPTVSVCFHPNSNHDLGCQSIAAGFPDGSVVFYECIENEIKMIHEFKGHLESVRDVCFTPDGSRLISVSSESTVRIWNIT